MTYYKVHHKGNMIASKISDEYLKYAVVLLYPNGETKVIEYTDTYKLARQVAEDTRPQILIKPVVKA